MVVTAAAVVVTLPVVPVVPSAAAVRVAPAVVHFAAEHDRLFRSDFFNTVHTRLEESTGLVFC